MKNFDIITLGEPLMELAEVERNGQTLYLPGFGGDTSNVAVAAARQGARVAIHTALGDDTFGHDFIALWQREGINYSTVRLAPRERTGLYFINYGPDGHSFTYYRAGSAASLIKPEEIPYEAIAASKILHVSGISQAISTSACDAVFAAIHHAKKNGVQVSYDSNLRLNLWPLDRARAVIHAAMAQADIARPGLDDARQLTGLGSPDEICDFYLNLGCKMVALTLGKDGTMIALHGRREIIPTHTVEAIDATGAGDTFGGAFLAQLLHTNDPFAAAIYANIAAALSTQGKGAVTPIPHRMQIEPIYEHNIQRDIKTKL